MESAAKRSRKGAWEQSVLIGFAAEASVLAHKGHGALRRPMARRGQDLMVRFVAYKASGGRSACGQYGPW